MPNTAQARKRLRQDAERAALNRSKRSKLRTEMKKFYTAVKEHNVRKAEAHIRVATALLDKAAKVRLYHPNNVARKKSKMARALHELQHRND